MVVSSPAEKRMRADRWMSRTRSISSPTPEPCSAEMNCCSTQGAKSSRRSRSVRTASRSSLRRPSHLLIASTMLRPASMAKPSSRRSCSTIDSRASSTSTTTSARCIASRVLATENFSIISSTRPRLRTPAVSISVKRSPSRSKGTKMLSRVVPGASNTITLSSPSSRFTRVDLPTFGRPTIATVMPRSVGSSPSSSGCDGNGGRAARIASPSCPMPRLCAAETGTASPKPSSNSSSSRSSSRTPSALLATSSTGRPCLRSSAAISWSSGVTPSRRSTRNSARSLSSSACRTWPVMSARIEGSKSPPTRPPVSISEKACSSMRAMPYWRSRVSPGMSATNASRVDVRRLKSVDLPTFGRPTSAIWRSVVTSPRC